MERCETVIVGAGLAGLATSCHLSQRGREHLVLEQAARPANAWRNERWDSFTLVTPNWALRIPGAPYDGPDPDGFMARDEVVATFDRYVTRFDLPVRCDSRVDAVEPLAGGGYRLSTSGRTYEAANVVIASGYFQRPRLPRAASELSPAVTQLHSGAYRNPASLPDGGVLVVGSAQSGCQIAEELRQAGRPVYLATGSAGRVPRRYRGRDIIAWLEPAGIFDLTPEQLPPGMSKFGGIPHFSGTRGGHSINLHHFARDGITLLGHLRGATGDVLTFAPDLHQNLAKADDFERDVVNMIDGFIHEHGIDAPAEELFQAREGFAHPVIERLDLEANGVRTVIWAMGYTFDYSLVRLPVRDAEGFPLQERGVTSYPGLYFAGMPWMPAERSGSLLGIGDAASYVAAHIADRAEHGSRLVAVAGGSHINGQAR